MRTAAIVAGLWLASLLAACGAQDTTRQTEPGVPAGPPEERDPPERGEQPGEADPPEEGDTPGDGEPTPGGVEPGLGGLVESAVTDLAERLDVAPAEIDVVSAESVVWSDPSLGCPRPDMRYRQVPQDGARIQLEHDGRTYDYHSGGDRPDPFLCERPAREPEPPGGDIDI